MTHFKFKHLTADGEHSIVKCYPKTGRTHQIRVHLEKLGYPIANDQTYGGKVKNDGKMQMEKAWFDNSYQNKEEGGKKEFLILWLHAYKYTYEDLKVKTDVPEWAKKSQTEESEAKDKWMADEQYGQNLVKLIEDDEFEKVQDLIKSAQSPSQLDKQGEFGYTPLMMAS